MNTQRTDDESAALDGVLKRFELGVAGKQFRRLAVRLSGVSAATDLDRFHAQVLQIVECLFQGLIRKQHGEYANLHSCLRLSSDLIHSAMQRVNGKGTRSFSP
jgi:hypothetical protein